MLTLLGIILSIIINGFKNPDDCVKLEAIFVGSKPTIIVKQACDSAKREIKFN